MASGYVAYDGATGLWQVVVDGQLVAVSRTQNEAENTYNTIVGNPNLQPTWTGGTVPTSSNTGGNPLGLNRSGPTTLAELQQALQAAGYGGPWDQSSMVAAFNGVTGAPAGGSPGGNFPGLWGALTDTNQQQFDWQKDQYNRTLQEQQRQYNQSSYSNLATSLLNSATQLRGPENYLQYATYTNGGRDIFDSLFGNQANAQFGGVTGYSPAISLQDVLAQLGMVSPGGGAAGGVAGLDSNAALDYIWQKRPDLASFFTSNGWNIGTPDLQRAATTEWLNNISPEYKGMTPQQVAGQLGYAAPTGATGGTVGATGGTTNSALDYIWQARPDLASFFQGNGWDVSTPDAQRAAANNWITSVDPQWSGMSAQDVARKLGYTASALQQATAPLTGGSVSPAAASNPYINPVTGGPSGGAPNPWQINPMVWDSLSPTAQKMVLDSVQMGNTPAGAWTAEDYLRQIENSRPSGTAPRSTQMSWAVPGAY